MGSVEHGKEESEGPAQKDANMAGWSKTKPHRRFKTSM